MELSFSIIFPHSSRCVVLHLVEPFLRIRKNLGLSPRDGQRQRLAGDEAGTLVSEALEQTVPLDHPLGKVPAAEPSPWLRCTQKQAHLVRSLTPPETGKGGASQVP